MIRMVVETQSAPLLRARQRLRTEARMEPAKRRVARRRKSHHPARRPRGRRGPGSRARLLGHAEGTQRILGTRTLPCVQRTRWPVAFFLVRLAHASRAAN